MAALKPTSSAIYRNFGALCFVIVFGIRVICQTKKRSSLLWSTCGALRTSNDSSMSRKFPSMHTAEESLLLDMTLSHWVIGSQRFEGTYCLHLQQSVSPGRILRDPIAPWLSVKSDKIGIIGYTAAKTPKPASARIKTVRTYKIRSLNLRHK